MLVPAAARPCLGSLFSPRLAMLVPAAARPCLESLFSPRLAMLVPAAARPCLGSKVFSALASPCSCLRQLGHVSARKSASAAPSAPARAARETADGRVAEA